MHVSLEERFWSKVEKSKDGCWLWTGSVNNRGYGRINRCGKSVYAHRVSYELAFGSIEDGMSVCHGCDTPACVRPSHLFVGTQKQNSEDMVAKGRHHNGWDTATHCVKGHEFTDDNTYVYGLGWRGCRECRRVSKRESERRRRERARGLRIA